MAIMAQRRVCRPRVCRALVSAKQDAASPLAPTPTELVRMPTKDAANRLLVDDETLEKLLEAAGRQADDFRDVRDTAVLAILVFCGLRRQELLDHSLAEQAIGQHAKRIPRPKRIVAQRSSSRVASESNGSGQEEPKELPEVAQKRRLTGRKGAPLRTTFEEGSYGKDAFYHVRLDGSQVTVCYNRDHPFYQVLHDYQSDPRTIAVPDQIEPGGGTFSGGESH
jgi:integrase